MNCDSVRHHLALYLYGELDFNQEEALEQHCESCAGCRAALERERALHAMLDSARREPPPELLHASRQQLRARIAAAGASRWERTIQRARAYFPVSVFWKPAAAVALLAVGFFAGQRWNTLRPAEPADLRLHSIARGPQGGVKLVLEEVRRRTLTGRPEEDRIRRMLLAAASEATDPGLRARTLECLKDLNSHAEVRRALVEAVLRDADSKVRLKAIEALRPLASEPETRRVLAHVVLADSDPNVRTEAINLLADNVEIDVVGTLQELILRETNPYIRQKSLQALQQVNASVETF